MVSWNEKSNDECGKSMCELACSVFFLGGKKMTYFLFFVLCFQNVLDRFGTQTDLMFVLHFSKQ